MPRKIPLSVNYGNPLISLPSNFARAPKEGPRFIPMELDWNIPLSVNMTAFSVNIQNNAILTFTQIAALKIDNSNCEADITIYFPDSMDTVVVPARAPYALVPVFTNTTQFYISCGDASTTDVSYIELHNVIPPPVVISEPLSRTLITNNNANIHAGTTILTTGSGAVSNIFIGASIAAVAVAFTMQIQLKSVASNAAFATAILSLPAGGTFNGLLVEVQGIDTQFDVGGLEIVQTLTAGVDPNAGSIYWNIAYE